MSPLVVDSTGNTLTVQIIGAAMTVHNRIGSGYKEEVYEEALAIELRQRGLTVARQYPVPVAYRGENTALFYLDLFVEGQVVVEVKAFSHQLTNDEHAQVINDLKATGAPVGLLFNFGRRSLQTKRLFPGKAGGRVQRLGRDDVRKSQRGERPPKHHQSPAVIPPKRRVKVIHIVGARPNFMKVAPILRAMERSGGFENLLVHTGQHYDPNMSDVFFDDLNLPHPDINLGVGSGTHAEQTANVMLRFEPVALEHRPHLVLVVGDVNSTLACTLVAAKLHIPVAHVEAGVRSFDRTMPEEINRVATDALADWLFTPSRSGNENLRREGLPESKIHFVGNVMVDTLLAALELARARQTWLQWGLAPRQYAVATLHRAANVDDEATLLGLVTTLRQAARQIPILFPIHPRTAKRLADAGFQPDEGNGRLLLVEPQGYLDFLCLLGDARLALTDSGGVQAETSVLGVPCLTLRRNTEWVETLTEGSNTLVGDDPQAVLEAVGRALSGPGKSIARPEKWDGLAAQRIVDVLAGISAP